MSNARPGIGTIFPFPTTRIAISRKARYRNSVLNETLSTWNLELSHLLIRSRESTVSQKREFSQKGLFILLSVCIYLSQIHIGMGKSRLTGVSTRNPGFTPVFLLVIAFCICTTAGLLLPTLVYISGSNFVPGLPRIFDVSDSGFPATFWQFSRAYRVASN